jgi:hypothetical protein
LDCVVAADGGVEARAATALAPQKAIEIFRKICFWRMVLPLIKTKKVNAWCASLRYQPGIQSHPSIGFDCDSCGLVTAP